MSSKKIKLRGDRVNLHYSHEGKGKINIIFIHGWNIDHSYWDSQADLLKKDYSVYALDLPGFGDSKAEDREVWSMEEFALDITDFISHLELENVILVGHSMSGGIILDVAVKSTEKQILALIAVDTLKAIGAEPTEDDRWKKENFMNRMAEDYKEAVSLYTEAYLFSPFTSEEVRKRVKKDFEDSDPETGMLTFKGLLQNGENIREKLQLIPQKLYLINSDYRPTDTESLQKYCKNGFELLTVHGTGHYPMIEKPEEFNMLIKGIIDNVTKDYENELTTRVSDKVEAPVQTVWQALTDPEIISKYMYGVKYETDWQVGSTIKWNGIWNGKLFEHKGRILEMDPPYSFKYSYYNTLSDLPDEEESYGIISYQLAEETGQTLVLITQDNNRTKKQRDEAESTWKEMLKELKKAVEH